MGITLTQLRTNTAKISPTQGGTESKNALTDEGVAAVVEVYRAWETREKLSRVITLAEAWEADYNLSPSLFVETNDRAQHRTLSDIVDDLNEAYQLREEADSHLLQMMTKLGLRAREI